MIYLNPFAVAKGGTRQLSFTVQYKSGAQYDHTAVAAWSSSNTSMATVNAGLVSGTAPGSFVISANDPNVPDYSYACYGSNSDLYCPQETGQESSGSGSVVSISSVSPAPFIIGTNGILTIRGSGFSGKGTPTVQFDAGGITALTANVVDDNTVQANYSVSCSASAQNLSLTFPTPDQLQIQTNSVPLSVGLPPAPTPKIMFGGNDITNTTQSVVVGQQIALSAPSPSLPMCMSLSSQSWSTPPGTAVGGYSASLTSGSVTPLPSSTGSSYQFYWVSPGNPLNMTYQYTMSGGGDSVGSPVAMANFNVAGPSSPSVAITTGHVAINSGPLLQFGGTLSNIGITFNASATPPSGYANAFRWVQLITNDTSVLTPSNGGSPLTCVPTTQPIPTTGTGLDTSYPYDTRVSTNDNPSIRLTSTYKEVNRAFSARMFLMWSSGLSNSIPVPLGYVNWQTSGDAILTNSQTNQWSLKSGSGTGSPFQTSSSYPLWTSYVPYTGLTCH